MSKHDPKIFSHGTDKWAECSCGWASGACGSPSEATIRWSEHVRRQNAREALQEIDESK